MIDGEDDEALIAQAGEDDEPASGDTAEQQGGDVEQLGEVNDELDGDLVAEIEGDDEPAAEGDGEPEAERTLANKLRRLLRDSEREKLAIKRENEALKTTQAPKPVEVGKKPDRWDDDFDSEEAYDEALLAWTKRSADAEVAVRARTDAQTAAQQRVANAVQAMRAKAIETRLKNYDEAEIAVQKMLAPSLAEAIPMLLGDQAAPLIQALHNNPALIEKINKAVADDPALGLAAGLVELTRLSMRIKMPAPKRKSDLQAEEIVRGSAQLSVVGDKVEAALEKEAERTNDYSKLFAHRASKRKQSRAA